MSKLRDFCPRCGSQRPLKPSEGFGECCVNTVVQEYSQRIKELERPLADAVEEQTPLRLDVKLDGVWLVAEPECGPKGIINLSHLVERMPKSIAKTAACNAIGESVSAILTALEDEE